MSEKVVSLHGGPLPARATNEHCVETLEKYLEKARFGEIVGIVIAAQFEDKMSGWDAAGLTYTHSIVGALEAAKFSLLKDE